MSPRGVERHHRQVAPFEFLHHSQWLRAEVLPLPGGGRLRFWSRAAPPAAATSWRTVMVASGKRVSAEALDQTADGLMVHDAEGRIVMANRPFAKLYAWMPGRGDRPALLRCAGRAWAGAAMARRRGSAGPRIPVSPARPSSCPCRATAGSALREHRT